MVVLAAVLRFATLDVQSFYSDETVTAVLMRMDFSSMLDKLSASESAPPLYYVLAWAWGNVFGTGEVGLRSLSALIGTAMVPIAYLVGARLSTRRVGLILAALAAVNPMLVWFSQEARVYELFALLAGLSFLAFLIALEDSRPRSIALWGVASAFAIAAHYFAAFMVIPEAALLLAAGRARRNVAIASAGLAVVALGLLPLAVEQRDNGGTGWISENPIAERIADTGYQFLAGPNAPAPLLIGGLAVALVIVGLWLLISRGDPHERGAARTAAIVGVTAIAVPLLTSIVGPDTFLQKTMIMAWLPLAAVVAVGLGARRAGRIGILAATALCSIGLLVVVAVASTPKLQRDDWRGAAEAIDGSPNDRIVVFAFAVAGGPHSEALQFYLPSLTAIPDGARVPEVQVLSLNDNGLDAQVRGVPEMPELAPPPGFTEADRLDDDRFTLITYTSPVARVVPAGWIAGVEDSIDSADRGPTKALLLPAGPDPVEG